MACHKGECKGKGTLGQDPGGPWKGFGKSGTMRCSGGTTCRKDEGGELRGGKVGEEETVGSGKGGSRREVGGVEELVGGIRWRKSGEGDCVERMGW